MFKNGMRPIHPGGVLREDSLKPAQLSANALATKPAPPLSLTRCGTVSACSLTLAGRRAVKRLKSYAPTNGGTARQSR